MSLINNLNERITPHVLTSIKNQDGDNADKSNLLTAFYAIFAGRLSNEDVYQRANALPDNELEHGHHLLNVAFSDVSTGEDQIASLSNQLADEYHVSPVTARTAIATAAPLALARIKEQAGALSVPSFIRTQLAKEENRLPTWAHALLPAGLFATAATTAAEPVTTASAVVKEPVKPSVVTEPVHPAAATTPVKTPTAHHYENKEKSPFLKTILPIIGLIIFAGLAWLLLRACQDKPTPVAAPVATDTAPVVADNAVQADPTQTGVAQAPATLSLSIDETGQALYSHRAQVGSEELAGHIRAAIAQVFGAQDLTIQNTNVHTATMPAAEHLPAILGLMKGVPNSSVVIHDHTVRFNATTPEDVAKLVEGAKNILPADFTVEAEPELDINTAVADSIETARIAIVALGDTVEENEMDILINALNTQIINFALDSTEIPQENKEILDLAAEKLKAVPETTLRIIGHTDTQGTHEYNQDLSESRAAAVKEYLVSKGVAAERLNTQGASFDYPVASNATEQGRFQNRRIEFVLFQEGEAITQVGHAEDAPTPVAQN
ncbi:OmpA family protein [Moraxella catarrhalis]|uniref:OmpA family protein n=1 Tax=Moraxella catarrhalis TaxID=480 RepID=UPI0007E4AD0F|nr:OmpA family protein [Moraxella catarrhalis]MPW64834.1 OmpA family protein [Moraxella catarrhalis]OAV14412.1 Outer membrane protein [Moraxella catarrhalis]OAV16199.1 Outer membrane protein [Moraxella catarrhalis]OBX43850.1 cell envelope biogenesis protein OmpA [Moraxella catarrhalis]